MPGNRNISILDRLLIKTGKLLGGHTLPSDCIVRPSPALQHAERIDNSHTEHAAGLMRINHTGEVCAQALYRGQELTAAQSQIRESMQQAAKEERDHFDWCSERLTQLGSHTSRLNPLFYTTSFCLGALAGLAGDKWSLGFVAETEKQVCLHLEDHLQKLPVSDTKSRAILEQMKIDENKHANTAIASGAATLPLPVRKAMGLMSQVMTRTTYYW